MQALALVEQALALDPFHSWVCGVHLFVRCQACMALGRYDDAVAACEKTASLDEYSWFTYVYLVAAYGQQGDTAKAAAEKVKRLRQRPGFSIAYFEALRRRSSVPAFRQQTETYLYAGLRRAGIPEN